MTEIEFEDAKSPDYKYIYATGAFGGITPTSARIIFYVDRLEPKTLKEGENKGTLTTDKVIRELQVEVHMSPQEFEKLWKWMGERLQSYKRQLREFTFEAQEIADKTIELAELDELVIP